MKIAELTGAALDYWVAKIDPTCEGCGIAYVEDHAAGPHYVGTIPDGVAFFIPTTGIAQQLRLRREYDAPAYRPHMDWSQGGLIIERERIELTNYNGIQNGKLNVRMWRANNCRQFDDPSPLVAAMRAFVASRFGNEVPDVREEKL